MLKVECESCKAPYQIDERRVPPAGLKMRCPKCGHSFLVSNPSAGGGAGAGASPATPAAAAAGKAPPPPKPACGPFAAPSGASAMKRTMMGVAPPPAMASHPTAPAVPAAKAESPARPAPPAPPAPPARPDPFARAAPARAEAPANRDDRPSDFPAALGTLGEDDLPVVAADLPATRVAPPFPGAPKPPTGVGLSAGAPRKPPAAPAPPPMELDFEPGLPVVHADLPATRAAKPAPPKPAPAKPPAPAPAAAAPATSSASRGFDLDLPSPKHPDLI